MRLAETSQLRIELVHVRRRWIFIVCAEVTHDRAGDIFGSFERRRPVAPGRKWIAAVIHDTGLDGGIDRRHQINNATTHAEADDADLARLDRLV